LPARTGNRTGGILLAGRRPRPIPARSGRPALFALLHAVARRPSAPDGRRVDLAPGVGALLRPPRRRGLAVGVSGFLCTSPWPRALRYGAARHQVLAGGTIRPRHLDPPSVAYPP